MQEECLEQTDKRIRLAVECAREETRLEPLFDEDDVDVLSKELATDDEKSKGSDGKGEKQNNNKNKKKTSGFMKISALFNCCCLLYFFIL